MYRISFSMLTEKYAIWKQITQGECQLMKREYWWFDSPALAHAHMVTMLGVNHPAVMAEGYRYGILKKQPASRFFLRKLNPNRLDPGPKGMN